MDINKMDVFKYATTVPEKRERELIINLLIENLASINALMVELSLLSRANIAENPERFPEIVVELKEKILIGIVASIEKKYGE
jgi:hypothetical protein